MKSAYAGCWILFSLLTLGLQSQVINESYNKKKNLFQLPPENDIVVTPTSVQINVKVIYNAKPDGYLITYTQSYIGRNIQEVEQKTNQKMDSLAGNVKKLGIKETDVIIDVLSLDPIFDFMKNDSIEPLGYKVTQNITFNIRSISMMRELTTICLSFAIRDLVNAQPYVKNSKPIYDSISMRTIELLNMKKKLCSDAGFSFAKGNPTISKYKEVLYPSERYLTALVKNASLFKHHLSQNSTISLERQVDVENYYDLNLKDADFVFNANLTGPVVQFYSCFNYGFIRTDTEEEMRKKIKEELEQKQNKTFYILDKNGNLKKVEM